MVGARDDICDQVLDHLRHTGGDKIPVRLVRALRQASEQGDPEATRMLGYLYEHGVTMPRDMAAAFLHYKRAADLGSPAGMYNVAIMLSQPEQYGTLGITLTDDERQSQAIQWWERAFALGDANSAVCLAEAYEKGRGVPADVDYAIRLYSLGTERGNVEAAVRLAFCYKEGIGVERDVSEMVRLLKIACDGGQPWACYELGKQYYDEEIPSDDPIGVALEYFERAARSGLPIAQECCGELYSLGHKIGIPRDLEKGIYFLERALEANRPRAKYIMAWLLTNGEGVTRDLKKAYRLCAEAAEAGESDAEHLMKWITENASLDCDQS